MKLDLPSFHAFYIIRISTDEELMELGYTSEEVLVLRNKLEDFTNRFAEEINSSIARGKNE